MTRSLKALLKAKVEQTLADQAPPIPQADVFAELRVHHAKRDNVCQSSSPRA